MALVVLWHRCSLCADVGYYLDTGSNQCIECPSIGRGIGQLVGIIVGVTAALVGGHITLVHPAGERLALLHPVRRAASWLACYAKGVGFWPKVKIVISFYGIATSLGDVYDAQMPPAYNQFVVAAFSWMQINWVSASMQHSA